MVRLGDVVGHKGRQQRVDRSKQSQNKACFEQFRQMLTEVRQDKTEPSLRNGTDAVEWLQPQRLQPIVVEHQHRQRRHNEQGQQW